MSQNLKGKQYFPWEVIPKTARAAVEVLVAAERAVPARGGGEKTVGVWMTAEDYAGLRQRAAVDPAVAAHVARQQAGCGHCGDPGV